MQIIRPEGDLPKDPGELEAQVGKEQGEEQGEETAVPAWMEQEKPPTSEPQAEEPPPALPAEAAERPEISAEKPPVSEAEERLRGIRDRLQANLDDLDKLIQEVPQWSSGGEGRPGAGAPPA